MTGMEWHIESQDELPNNMGYMITIAEHTDSGHLTGAAITVPCETRLDETPVSTEEAIRDILRQVRMRIGEYLGYVDVSLSKN
jgi:hypothetical protein